MGLFGRDDKSSRAESAAPAAPRPAPSSSSAAASAGARTVIARGGVVEGTLGGGADIVVEGEVKGVVDGAAGLLIAETGRLQASLHARHVTVAGHVKGDISAEERIQLEPTAQVVGNITAPRILIKEGATFDGKVEMKAPRRAEKPTGKAVSPDRAEQAPPAVKGKPGT